MRLLLFILVLISFIVADEEKDTLSSPKDGTKVDHNNDVFRPDPTYEDKPYNTKEQLDIYGRKKTNHGPRPLLELDRPLHSAGELYPAMKWWPFGKKNPELFHILVFGDLRTAIGYFRNDDIDQDQASIAWELNLNIDVQLTSTERVHLYLRPLRNANMDVTRWDFAGDNTEFENEIQFNPEALFFEGDLGRMLTGWTGKDAGFDLPIAAGLINFLFHNGIWFNDAFTGVAFTIPAINIPSLNISNMDITFFAGFDEVDSDAVGGGNVDENNAKIFGTNIFIEAMRGYWEIGYGYTYDHDKDDGDASYHNIMVSFSKRYGDVLANSIRVLGNFGQDNDINTADGVLFLIENSLITSFPSTLIPYLNLFAGFDNPIPLAHKSTEERGVLFQSGITLKQIFPNYFPDSMIPLRILTDSY